VRIVARSRPDCRKPLRRFLRFGPCHRTLKPGSALQCGCRGHADPHPYLDRPLRPRLPRSGHARSHAPSSLQNIRLSADVGNPLGRVGIGGRMVTDASVHVMQISRGGSFKGVKGFPSAPDRRKPVRRFLRFTVAPDSEPGSALQRALGVGRSCTGVMTPTPTWTRAWDHECPAMISSALGRRQLQEHPSQLRCG
jgi:hypothetical protein